jgi:cytochrome oxidase Cu insertion factor (SCO1/SenC/PrrC family)
MLNLMDRIVETVGGMEILGKIRKFQKKDTKECGDLIRKVYIKFNSKEDTEESSEDYASHFSTDKKNIEVRHPMFVIC